MRKTVIRGSWLGLICMIVALAMGACSGGVDRTGATVAAVSVGVCKAPVTTWYHPPQQ